MLYTRVLAILFQSPTPHNRTPPYFYSDADMLLLPTNNQLTENYLRSFREANKPENLKKASKHNPIEHFYVILA